MIKGKIRRSIVGIVAVVLVAAAVMFAWKWVETELIYPVRFQETVEKNCEEYNVEKELAYAVINCESGFDEAALSSAGAIGLMQITPETFTWLQTKDETEEVFGSERLYDKEINIKYGIMLLSLNIKEFGDIETALAAYNAGRGVVNEWLGNKEYSPDSRNLLKIPYPETEKYVQRVLEHYERYKNLNQYR